MTTAADVARRFVASIASVISLVALAKTAPNDWWVISIPLGLLLVAAAVIHITKFGPQLLARAVWWANLALGIVLTAVGSSSERDSGLVITVLMGLALLVIGRKGLAEASEKEAFAPAAFRSSLLLMMVFALADAQTFLLFAIVAMQKGNGDSGVSAVAMAFAGLLYLVGFVGLYRVQIWGAFIGVLTSALMFVLVATGAVHLDHDINGFLLMLNAVHVIAGAPMILSVMSGRKLPFSPSPLLRQIGSIAVICALILVGVFCWSARGLTRY